jgi:hypothetical protein
MSGLHGKELLLWDLNNQKETLEREQLRKHIVRGAFSDFGSDSATPATDLLIVLEAFSKKDIGYKNMYEKALYGFYDHPL